MKFTIWKLVCNNLFELGIRLFKRKLYKTGKAEFKQLTLYILSID